MKDAKQFFTDYTEDLELRGKMIEAMNRLRADGSLEPWQAGQKAARVLGYEIPDEAAKTLLARLHGKAENDTEELSDFEAKAAAGGGCAGMDSPSTGCLDDC